MQRPDSHPTIGYGKTASIFRCALLLVVWLILLRGASVFRLTELENRPMHCDEAVHAVKFQRLLEDGEYVYDPHEYHGPGLNYLTLPIAWAVSVERIADVTEVHLRLLPALFGVLLVALTWLARKQLGHGAALYAALLTAASPAMVFYSRYYIQEMLLVCFTFGAIVALWRYAEAEKVSGTDSAVKKFRTHWVWLVMSGACIGMMHVSKETCVIAMFAMATAAILVLAWPERMTVEGIMRCGSVAISRLRQFGVKRLVLVSITVTSVAACVSVVFFSSFFDNPRGIIDSISTYSAYLGRAAGEGSAGQHDYPWYDYFHRLFYWKDNSGAIWTEALIPILALVGLVAAVLGKGIPAKRLAVARFLGIYTLLMTVVYSALPYKTPWCALGFLHGMILLGGIGAAVLVRVTPKSPKCLPKCLTIALLIMAAGQLAWQAHRASFKAYEAVDNPYVYAHTTSDVLGVAQRVRQITRLHPDGSAMPIQVICPDGDYWPMPWYLRGFSRVGYLDQPPKGLPAPLIITQPAMQEDILKYLFSQPFGVPRIYGRVLPEEEGVDWQLRPNVPLRMLLRQDIWNEYELSRANLDED